MFRSMAPLHEIDYLYQNAQCFKNSRELCNTIARQKSKVCFSFCRNN